MIAAPVACQNLAARVLAELPMRLNALLLFAPQNGLRHQIKAMLNADRTFTGLYHWNWFDAAVLLPYFAVMLVLAIYGVHRYTMCYLYFKYKKNYDPNPPKHFDELPRVTVQLPIFNEQFVIDRLIEAVCAMEYPKDRLEIQVLDDSTDETQQSNTCYVILLTHTYCSRPSFASGRARPRRRLNELCRPAARLSKRPRATHSG